MVTTGTTYRNARVRIRKTSQEFDSIGTLKIDKIPKIWTLRILWKKSYRGHRFKNSVLQEHRSWARHMTAWQHMLRDTKSIPAHLLYR